LKSSQKEHFENHSLKFLSQGVFQLQNAPSDWISSNQIHIYDDKIVIDLADSSLSSYAATGSMKPVLDKGTNGIRIKPESAGQIKAGDIISFSKQGDLIVHRVVEKGEDSRGVYFVTKGDNNDIDDGKVRFEDIKYITVALIY
jgi:signal peptidase I